MTGHADSPDGKPQTSEITIRRRAQSNEPDTCSTLIHLLTKLRQPRQKSRFVGVDSFLLKSNFEYTRLVFIKRSRRGHLTRNSGRAVVCQKCFPGRKAAVAG